MKKVTINSQLKEKLPDFCVGVLSFKMKVLPENKDLTTEMLKLGKDIQERFSLETLLKDERILEGRNGYKALGKDPSRYRLSTEALMRRLVKGNDLYQINTAVDIGNLISATTRRCIGVLDEDKIVGDVEVRIGGEEAFEGIGRGAVNISNLPLYADDLGPFGSLTSDTPRTRIQLSTENVLILLFSFGGPQGLQDDLDFAMDVFRKFGDVKEIEIVLLV